METKKDRTALIALVAGGIALLLGLCLGALGGGVTGFLIGRQSGERAVERITSQQIFPEQEMPTAPDVPQLPRLLNAGGALISEVVADTPAAKAGLQAGDLITAVDETPVDANHPLASVLSAFKPGERVVLTIVRGTRTQSVPVTLGEHPDNPSQAYLGVRYVDASMRRLIPTPQD